MTSIMPLRRKINSVRLLSQIRFLNDDVKLVRSINSIEHERKPTAAPGMKASASEA